MKSILKKLTFWKTVAGIIIAAGCYATYVRFTQGLGASTNLSDEFPWGIWIGFDILCGVGLAAGGFTLAAIVYIFNIKKFEPIIRPTILTAFMGYVLVVAALLFDLGRPLQIWHAMIMWNPRSVMFEVAWCVMLYTTVLSLEFAPVVLEKFHLTRTKTIIKRITLPLIILGVLLSTLHQSSLGSLYLIIPEKLYALWYTPYLPVLFYVSAIAVGCAMIIFELFLSARAFNHKLPMDLLSQIAKVAVVMLAVLLTMKVMDLVGRHEFGLLVLPRKETYFYWFEVMVGIIAPLVLLAIPKIRQSHNGLFLGASLIVIGFILNRLNISITGIEAWAGFPYFPSWMELAVTAMIVTLGFVIFSLAAKYLPLFSHGDTHEVSHTSDPRSVKSLAKEWEEDLKLVSQS